MSVVPHSVALNPKDLQYTDGVWTGLYLLGFEMRVPYGGDWIYHSETTINNEYSYTVTDIAVGQVDNIGGSDTQIRISIENWGELRPSYIYYNSEKDRWYVR